MGPRKRWHRRGTLDRSRVATTFGNAGIGCSCQSWRCSSVPAVIIVDSACYPTLRFALCTAVKNLDNRFREIREFRSVSEAMSVGQSTRVSQEH